MQETEEMAAQEPLIAMTTCAVRCVSGGGGGGSVSTGKISHPVEKKQIFPTPCDGWHHGSGLCILSPFQISFTSFKSALGGVGGVMGG